MSTPSVVRVLILLAAILAMPSLSTSRAEAALATDFGPELAAAQPANGFVGKLSVAPLHASEGANVTVSGDALPANQEFDLVWRTVKGSWKAASGEYHGRDYAPIGYRIAHVKTDAAGKFAASFIVPDDFGFQHDIVLQQGTKLFTQAGFNLDMTMKVTPENGPPGTPITFDIKGIGFRELENSWMLVYDNNFTGWISSVSTHGSAHFTIPATGPVGTHVLQLIHGEFTFPYMNPQQNPVPDRPRFKTNFIVTRGEAVLPPPVEAQTQKSVRTLAKPGALVRHQLSPASDVRSRSAARASRRARVISCNGRRSPAIVSSPAAGKSVRTRSPKRKPMRAASLPSNSRCLTISAARTLSSSRMAARKRPAAFGSKPLRCRSACRRCMPATC